MSSNAAPRACTSFLLRATRQQASQSAPRGATLRGGLAPPAGATHQCTTRTFRRPTAQTWFGNQTPTLLRPPDTMPIGLADVSMLGLGARVPVYDTNLGTPINRQPAEPKALQAHPAQMEPCPRHVEPPNRFSAKLTTQRDQMITQTLITNRTHKARGKPRTPNKMHDVIGHRQTTCSTECAPTNLTNLRSQLFLHCQRLRHEISGIPSEVEASAQASQFRVP